MGIGTTSSRAIGKVGTTRPADSARNRTVGRYVRKGRTNLVDFHLSNSYDRAYRASAEHRRIFLVISKESGVPTAVGIWCFAGLQRRVDCMQTQLWLPVSSWRGLAAISILCFASCSKAPTLNPVQGKVLHKDQPVKGAVVTLHPKQGVNMNTILPVGLTSEDGTFSVTTGENIGAAAGEYIVTFICPEDVLPKGKTMTMGMSVESQDRFKNVYSDKATSKFQIEVKPGLNQLTEFRLR